jgi:hypothetical protein
MRFALVRSVLLISWLGFLLTLSAAKAQSTVIKQAFDYQELKGLLAKHKSTVSSILGMKRFRLASSKERPESTIYAYKKESGTTRILVRIRKSDGLVSEVAWKENSETLGNLTHDAVYDGFVPVAGNSQYYNRFHNMALLVNYKLADDEVIPCILRVVNEK